MRSSSDTYKTPLLLCAAVILAIGCGGGGGGEMTAIDPLDSSLPPTLELQKIASCGSSTNPLRIMPLGDSITEAEQGHASYRYWLWKLFEADGCFVDFVGSRRGVTDGTTNGPELPPRFDDFDQDHEGHWGFKIDMVLPRIRGWVEAAQPDLVLIHLGTNDIRNSQSMDGTAEELGVLIDLIREIRPNAVVFLAQVIPSEQKTDRLAGLNARIPLIAMEKDTPAAPVVVVDQAAGFSLSSDLY
ncbi:MAG: hypothetical protein KDD44_13580, partial [Bdellovibrionales bacterium]|nr:hypothetical protein [Bdellovibrionales bacterium]